MTDIGDIPDFCRQNIIDCLVADDKLNFARLSRDASKDMTFHLSFGSVSDVRLHRKFERRDEIVDIIAGAKLIERCGGMVVSLALIDELTLDYDYYFERQRDELKFNFLRCLPHLEDLEISGRFAGAFCGLHLDGLYQYGRNLKRLVLCLQDHIYEDNIVLDLERLNNGCPKLEVLHIIQHTEDYYFEVKDDTEIPIFENLTDLWLSNTKFEVEYVSGMKNLKRLRLPVFADQSEDDFSPIADLDSLESLIIELTNGGFVEEFDFVAGMKNLKSLTFSESDLYQSENRVKDRGLVHYNFEDQLLSKFMQYSAQGVNPMFVEEMIGF